MMRHVRVRWGVGLSILMIVAACGRTPKPATAPAVCPIIPPRGAPYPTVTYHTLVLNGKVLYARRGQRNLSAHSSVSLDSANDALMRVRIKEIHFLTEESARVYEACPGVAVIAVETKHRWWWPW